MDKCKIFNCSRQPNRTPNVHGLFTIIPRLFTECGTSGQHSQGQEPEEGDRYYSTVTCSYCPTADYGGKAVILLITAKHIMLPDTQ